MEFYKPSCYYQLSVILFLHIQILYNFFGVYNGKYI